MVKSVLNGSIRLERSKLMAAINVKLFKFDIDDV